MHPVHLAVSEISPGGIPGSNTWHSGVMDTVDRCNYRVDDEELFHQTKDNNRILSGDGELPVQDPSLI